MFVGEEANVIERIAIFWLENESEQDEKMKADVQSILEKIEQQIYILNYENSTKSMILTSCAWV